MKLYIKISLVMIAIALSAYVVCAESVDMPDTVTVLISAAGDCTLGGEINSGIDSYFKSAMRKNGAEWFMENVRDIFENDDFTLVNLEGPLTKTKKHVSKRYVMRGDPDYAEILSSASVEVANLANNHSLDFRMDGLEDTKSALTDEGIGFCRDSDMFIAEKDGRRICFLGYEKWNNKSSEILNDITNAKADCDLLIVSIHWGEEYHYKPEKEQKNMGRAMIDAGADLVIGTHPHVIQGIERYNGKYIVYSLGNFCFGGHTAPEDKDCYIFQQQFIIDDSGVQDGGIRVIPCSISSKDSSNNYQPTPLTGKKAKKLLKKIAELSSLEGAVLIQD